MTDSPRMIAGRLNRSTRQKLLNVKGGGRTGALATSNEPPIQSTATTATTSTTTSTTTTSSSNNKPGGLYNTAGNNGYEAGHWSVSRSPAQNKGQPFQIGWERSGRKVPARAVPSGRESRSRTNTSSNPDFLCEQCHTQRACIAVGKMVLCRDCSRAGAGATSTSVTAKNGGAAAAAARAKRSYCQACEQRAVGARVRLAGDRIVNLCKPCAISAESNVSKLLQIGKTFGEPLASVVLRESRSASHKNTLVPLSIARLSAFLVRSGALADEGVFRIAGRKDHADALRAEIESALAPPPTASELVRRRFDPHVVTAVLKQYLRALPDSLCTGKLSTALLAFADIYDENGECARNSVRSDASSESTSTSTTTSTTTSEAPMLLKLIDVLGRLPAPNAQLLGLVLFLLSETVRYGQRTRMSARTAAICMAPSMLTQQSTIADAEARIAAAAGQHQQAQYQQLQAQLYATSSGRGSASPAAMQALQAQVTQRQLAQQQEQLSTATSMQRAARVVAAMLRNYRALVGAGVIGDGAAIIDEIVRHDGESEAHAAARSRLGSGSTTALAMPSSATLARNAVATAGGTGAASPLARSESAVMVGARSTAVVNEPLSSSTLMSASAANSTTTTTAATVTTNRNVMLAVAKATTPTSIDATRATSARSGPKPPPKDVDWSLQSEAARMQTTATPATATSNTTTTTSATSATTSTPPSRPSYGKLPVGIQEPAGAASLAAPATRSMLTASEMTLDDVLPVWTPPSTPPGTPERRGSLAASAAAAVAPVVGDSPPPLLPPPTPPPAPHSPAPAPRSVSLVAALDLASQHPSEIALFNALTPARRASLETDHRSASFIAMLQLPVEELEDVDIIDMDVSSVPRPRSAHDVDYDITSDADGDDARTTTTTTTTASRLSAPRNTNTATTASMHERRVSPRPTSPASSAALRAPPRRVSSPPPTPPTSLTRSPPRTPSVVDDNELCLAPLPALPPLPE